MSDFMIFDTTVPSQCYRYQKVILQRLIFFVKMKLVSIVVHINATTLFMDFNKNSMPYYTIYVKLYDLW